MLPSSPKGPCRAGKTTSAPSSPPPGVSSTAPPPQLQRPSRSIRHLDHLVARPLPGRGHRRRPSAARRRARRSGRRRGPRPSRRLLPGSVAVPASACRPRPPRACRRPVSLRCPASAVPAGRRLPADLAELRRCAFLLPRTVGFRPASRSASHRFGAQLADHVRHLRFPLAGGDDDRDGRAGVEFLAPALGDWRITWPPALRALFFGDARAAGRDRGSAAPRRAAGCRPAPAPWPASGRRRRSRVTSEPCVAVLPAAVRSGSPVPSSTDVGVDAFRSPTSKPAASSFFVASSRAGPACRAPCRCRGRC